MADPAVLHERTRAREAFQGRTCARAIRSLRAHERSEWLLENSCMSHAAISQHQRSPFDAAASSGSLGKRNVHRAQGQPIALASRVLHIESMANTPRQPHGVRYGPA